MYILPVLCFSMKKKTFTNFKPTWTSNYLASLLADDAPTGPSMCRRSWPSFPVPSFHGARIIDASPSYLSKIIQSEHVILSNWCVLKFDVNLQLRHCSTSSVVGGEEGGGRRYFKCPSWQIWNVYIFSLHREHPWHHKPIKEVISSEWWCVVWVV